MGGVRCLLGLKLCFRTISEKPMSSENDFTAQFSKNVILVGGVNR